MRAHLCPTPYSTSCATRRVWALHEDSEGGMWVGTHGGGLILLKGRSATPVHVGAGIAIRQDLFSGGRHARTPDADERRGSACAAESSKD